MNQPARRPSFLQILVHVGGWLPLAALLAAVLTDNLTANPIQALEQRTGIIALIFLVLSLACTPLAMLTGWQELRRRKKALGLYGFLYAVLHVTIFFAIDYGLDFAAIWRDVRNKSYILLGALAFLLLVPLAVTSIKALKRRMGKSWKRLHRLAYVIPLVVVGHFLLAVKGNLGRLQGNLLVPLLFGVVIVILLVLRIPAVKARFARKPR